VLAVAPGTVDTEMQAQLRATSTEDFPSRQKFLDLHANGKLADGGAVARDMWRLLDAGLENGSVVDLRTLPAAPRG
jgi:NAD(P)-dependent dehydrogenase (short-subunit alcohol dehydrogenase family)